ncbi:hypothetical protein AGDE_16220 [Angomonas deanei]|uniref:Uncharacterized protein n=1 Tax=Angomonas deanei TaxID=59799 RepID=A0A7G2C380_9TRYP|nr:hypothetical protein AGDE_16220 [Angomonas deanei]CAD2213591.1 hypothetical protein, conserved [Angomonas deanei]|eukprot:EPY17496.1 hypothetical protein AGDE_16220 [Angomonas deanei]
MSVVSSTPSSIGDVLDGLRSTNDGSDYEQSVSQKDINENEGEVNVEALRNGAMQPGNAHPVVKPNVYSNGVNRRATQPVGAPSHGTNRNGNYPPVMNGMRGGVAPFVPRVMPYGVPGGAKPTSPMYPMHTNVNSVNAPNGKRPSAPDAMPGTRAPVNQYPAGMYTGIPRPMNGYPPTRSNPFARPNEAPAAVVARRSNPPVNGPVKQPTPPQQPKQAAPAPRPEIRPAPESHEPSGTTSPRSTSGTTTKNSSTPVELNVFLKGPKKQFMIPNEANVNVKEKEKQAIQTRKEQEAERRRRGKKDIDYNNKDRNDYSLDHESVLDDMSLLSDEVKLREELYRDYMESKKREKLPKIDKNGKPIPQRKKIDRAERIRRAAKA